MYWGLTLSAIVSNIIFLSTIFLSNLFYYFHIYFCFFSFSKVLTAGIMGMMLVKVSSPSTTLVRTTSIYLPTLHGKMFNLQKYFEKALFSRGTKTTSFFFLATIIFVASLTKLVPSLPRDSSETFLLGAWRNGKLVGHRALSLVRWQIDDSSLALYRIRIPVSTNSQDNYFVQNRSGAGPPSRAP